MSLGVFKKLEQSMACFVYAPVGIQMATLRARTYGTLSIVRKVPHISFKEPT